MKFYANQHFLDFSTKYLSEILVEISTIMKRLAENEAMSEQMMSFEIPEVLTYMLGSSHVIVTRAALEALIALSKKYEVFSEKIRDVLEKTCIIELLLRIISEYDGEFIQLSANLLNILCYKEEMSRQVRNQRGNLILVNQLKKSKELSITLCLSLVILALCMETDNIKEFRTLGLVGLMIKNIESSQNPLEIINSLKILIDMTLDDETSYYIRVHGSFGITSLIFQYHPSQYPEDLADDIKPGLYEVQLNALQCIRFLYSVERNRKYFRKVFPPQIFASFIDIGNYVKGVSNYQSTLKLINSLGQDDVENIKEGLFSLKESPESIHTREIAGYNIGEILVLYN